MPVGLATGRRGQSDHLNMTMDMFNSGVDENGTPVIMFDITLGGTKNWQGGLNAKEPVRLTAFAWFFDAFACLCIEMQRISMFLTPCVCCSQSLSCCQCHATRAVLLRALSG